MIYRVFFVLLYFDLVKLLQKTFSSWYGIVLDVRLNNGKAHALADWRLASKVFNAWKKLSVSERVRKDQQMHQTQIKSEHMKLSRAVKFHSSRLVERAFDAWRRNVRDQLVARRIEADKMRNKEKMQRFLLEASSAQAAAQHNSSQIDTERSNAQATTVTPRIEDSFAKSHSLESKLSFSYI